MAIWRAKGWIELQELMHQKHGILLRPTCKGSTPPDQIWLSPELVVHVDNVALWDIFSDHQAVLAGIKLPKAQISELQWRLPGRVPWDKVDVDLWTSSPALGPLFQSNLPHEGSDRLAPSVLVFVFQTGSIKVS